MALGTPGNVFFIFTSEEMPNHIIMGCTTQPKLIEFHHDESPFTCFYACEVADGDEVEKRFNIAFGNHKTLGTRKDKDFSLFQIEPERVKALAELSAIKEITID